ncbi:MAG: polyphosphate kinase 2 family protein, partial [Planctomycetota bacterium]|nr:polyphosphate kinase 2 family protein [Planctomycetota bacterium]
MDLAALEQRFLVEPGSRVRLDELQTDLADGRVPLEGLAELKREAKDVLEAQVRALSMAQELLWASDRRSVLVVLQGMDTAGKDGLIRSMLTGVNPQGC